VSAIGAAEDFGCCRERLERAVSGACEVGQDWPSAVAGGVHAALEFALADPAAALVLTQPSGLRWEHADPEFVAMVDHFARLLSRGAPTPNPRLPHAPAVIARIARQVNLQIEAGRGEEMMEIAPDLAFLALMPYLGFAGARQWAQPIATA
jgi:hypothetical protein